MKLVLQRAVGDCGVAALATFLEQTYEDVYVASAKVDRASRGRNGMSWAGLIAVAKQLGVPMALRSTPLDDDACGLLAVKWRRPHQHPFGQHLVVTLGGVIVDPADGVILPAEEYLARYRATAGAMLVEA